MRVPVGFVRSLFLLLILIPASGLAGGILHVFPPRVEDRAFAVARPTVLLSRTMVTVSEQSIHYRIEQTFLNDNEFPLDGVFLLPLDRNTRPAKLDVRIDSTRATFRVLSWEAFFPILKELTASMKDPSLMGLAGKDVLMIRPVTMGIGRQRSFRIQYELPTVPRNDQMNLLVSMAGERYALGPVDRFEILVRFKMSRTVRTVFSPTHHVSVFRENHHRCLAVVKEQHKRIRHDFKLITTFSGTRLRLRLFAHRSPGRPGTFMGFIEPPLVPPSGEEPRKDVVFLLDTSGSMAAKGFERAKAALVSGLERLRPGDRFTVITIGTKPGSLANRLIAVSRENLVTAVHFVNSRQSKGGTDLYNGLIDALGLFRYRSRLNLVVLASDGRSTVGITDPETIIEDVRSNNRGRARVFVLAMGDTADVAMLDRLATSTKGISVHMSGEEDLDSVLKRLFTGISRPRVSDLRLNFKGLSPTKVVPFPIPDLFGSESLVVFGRYDAKTDQVAEVRLRGRVGKRVSKVSDTFTFPKVARALPYICDIWAMRQLAGLAEQHRLRGLRPDVTHRAESLAREFGLRSPIPLARPDASHHDRSDKTNSGKLLWLLKTSFVPFDVESASYRNVNGKLFRRETSGWIDTSYRADMATKTLEFLSKEFFSLVRATPEIGPYLALGTRVTFVFDQRAIRVTYSHTNGPR